MIASPEDAEEVALVIEDEQPVGDQNQNEWIQDMTTFLTEGVYPQGLDRTKRR